MNKSKKVIFSLLGIIIGVMALIGIAYYSFFYPKTSVKSINSDITLNDKSLLKKFIPNDLKFSLKEIDVKSNTYFTEDEITDLLIVTIDQNPKLKELIQGLKVKIENENINVYSHIKYKGIPIEAKLNFTAESKDGKGILHYKKGKIGFMSIPKETIFSDLEDTPILKFHKSKGDILLSFEELQGLKIKVTKITTENKKINITFEGKMNLFNRLK
ncbi:hypothetical protein [Hathewaya limosa]|uniref:Uncharacterized protein YpmS n=1 Tax=Hathewaya limosa TaxID=1536 RepID=A0ABU0JNU5_HATLI|nr:hypothetical protein [Hathewaya limosa]MDQ0478758.1 uncharacterized protein YpmS [Hathewaya limosa]